MDFHVKASYSISLSEILVPSLTLGLSEEIRSIAWETTARAAASRIDVNVENVDDGLGPEPTAKFLNFCITTTDPVLDDKDNDDLDEKGARDNEISVCAG